MHALVFALKSTVPKSTITNALKNAIKFTSVAFSLLLLFACKTPPTSTAAAPNAELAFLQRQQQLQRIDNFAIKARIGIQTSDDAVSATMHWTHLPPAFLFELYGTFGMGHTELSYDGQQAVLRLPDEPVMQSSDPTELLYSRLGWYIPLEQLPDWLLARQDGKRWPVTLNAQGQPESFQYQDWIISYQQYQPITFPSSVAQSDLKTETETETETETAIFLPRKLELLHPQLKIKLIIRDWQLQIAPDTLSDLANNASSNAKHNQHGN